MESYRSFANVYDELMDNVDYVGWSKQLEELLKENGVGDGLVLELGCGTGTMCELLAGKGYDLIGVDKSLDMLQVAAEKKEKSGYDILYLNQDMREFELYGTVRAVISICDSVNYILNPIELQRVFSLVNNYLDPGGLFVFDFNVPEKYANIGDKVIAENRENICFLWENEYDPESHLNRYELVLFIKEEDGRYRKEEETHIQRGYFLEEIKEIIMKSGLVFVDAFEGYNKNPIKKDSGRIIVIAKENGKEI